MEESLGSAVKRQSLAQKDFEIRKTDQTAGDSRLHSTWTRARGQIVLFAAVLSEAFQPRAVSLPADMTEGRVNLLYKGKGADRAQPASYRPITLLNTDYKFAARVLDSRLGPLLIYVVHSTQTGFLPQRWIGGSILAYLETVEFSAVEFPAVVRWPDSYDHSV